MKPSDSKSNSPLRDLKIEEAVQKYLAGEEDFFQDISRYVQPVIKQVLFARRFPGSYENEQDLTQEFWIETIKNLKRWVPERGTLKNFLFKCFINRSGNFLSKSNRHQAHVQIEDLEEVLASKNPFEVQSELDIRIKTRISGLAEEFIFRKVWLAVYLRVYHSSKKVIVKELQVMTGLGFKRVRFLMDYAVLALRRHYLEVGCKVEISDAAYRS